MEIVDEHVNEDLFAQFTEHMPEVCIEIVVERDGEVLIAKRANRPVQGEWFWPGGRLYKGEELEPAAERIANEELGIKVHVDRLLGVQSHFWDTSAVEDYISRHTVNIVFLVHPVTANPTIELDDQHTDYQFISEPQSSDHEIVKRYFKEYNFTAS